MKKLSDIEDELKKSVAYKKSVYITYIITSIIFSNQLGALRKIL